MFLIASCLPAVDVPGKQPRRGLEFARKAGCSQAARCTLVFRVALESDSALKIGWANVTPAAVVNWWSSFPTAARNSDSPITRLVMSIRAMSTIG